MHQKRPIEWFTGFRSAGRRSAEPMVRFLELSANHECSKGFQPGFDDYSNQDLKFFDGIGAGQTYHNFGPYLGFAVDVD